MDDDSSGCVKFVVHISGNDGGLIIKAHSPYLGLLGPFDGGRAKWKDGYSFRISKVFEDTR